MATPEHETIYPSGNWPVDTVPVDILAARQRYFEDLRRRGWVETTEGWMLTR